MVTFLWTTAVFLATVFAGIIVGVTLTPRWKDARFAMWWLGAGAVGYVLTYVSYMINLTNDFIGIVGLSLLLCFAVVPAYKEESSEKVFVAMMAALIANVSTFMFCGTTDTFLGAKLGLFGETGPYTVKNILLFIGIKIVVYLIIFLLYNLFAKKRVLMILEMAEGKLKPYLIAPAVSIVGFYVINYITNQLGIFPTSKWFLPLYATICIIMVVEYIQIFNSVKQTAERMKSEKEKERIGAELNVATHIQANMLPSIFPPFPERKEFDLYASMKPAKEVGGDFYDFFLIDDDHIALVMADVSGKGVPAALFMVIAKTLIKNHAQLGEYSPAKVLIQANEQLCEGNEAELFVTVWLAIIQISTGKGLAANAGHEHPAIRHANGEFELVKYRHSPAVATMEGMRFKEHEFTIEPGDTLFVYTDGVPEATNAANELFGEERLVKALNKAPDALPKEILKNVKEAVDDFVGGAPQFDDLTMLGFRYYGTEGK